MMQVTVKPPSGNQKERVEKISSFLNDSTTTTIADSSPMERRKLSQTLMVVSSALNQVNCTLPNGINCTTLNRQNCADTDRTCGTCFDGYIGESGDANTQCQSKVAIAAAAAQATQQNLNTNNAAPVIQIPKSCPGDCSGKSNGICEFHKSELNSTIYLI
jgi:hypothetical protein